MTKLQLGEIAARKMLTSTLFDSDIVDGQSSYTKSNEECYFSICTSFEYISQIFIQK